MKEDFRFTEKTRARGKSRSRRPVHSGWVLIALALPALAFAQASPFSTGATAAQTNFLAILTPIAVIAVMALGVAAWFNKISWGWAVAGIVGIVLVFGAPQIVAWVRGMFGV
jgi:type IV secretion system protein VirB2